MKAAANFRFYQRLIFPEGWRCDYSLSSDLFFSSSLYLSGEISASANLVADAALLLLRGSDSQTCDGCRASAAPFTKSDSDKCLALCAVGTRREKHPDSCCHQGVLKEEQEICYAGNVPHDQIQSRLTCGSLSQRGPAAGPSNSLKRPRSNHAPSGIGRAEAADWMRSYNRDRFGDKCSFSSVRGKLRRISISCRS